MNELQIFNNEEFGQVRMINVDGEPWLVGSDVANALGYADAQKAIKRHVDEDDKLIRQIVVSGQKRNVICINESGIYALIICSKLSAAKKFKRWITSEVLPSIRKHGAYMTPETIEKTLTDPDFLIQLATKLKEEKEARIKAEEKLEETTIKLVETTEIADRATTTLGVKDGFGWSRTDICNEQLRGKISVKALTTYLISDGLLTPAGKKPSNNAMANGLMFINQETPKSNPNITTPVIKFSTKGLEILLPCLESIANFSGIAKRAEKLLTKYNNKLLKYNSMNDSSYKKTYKKYIDSLSKEIDDLIPEVEILEAAYNEEYDKIRHLI